MRPHIPSIAIRRVALLLLVGWLVPSVTFATPTLLVDLDGTNLMTGIPFSAGGPPVQVGGEVSESVSLGGFGVNGPPVDEGYASDTGTFWALARTGIEPYRAYGRVYWAETYVKQSSMDTIEADITGAQIHLTDFGSVSTLEIRASIAFFAVLFPSLTNVVDFQHIAEVTGSYDDWTLVENTGDLAASTDFTTLNSGLSGDDSALWTLDATTLTFDLQHIPIGGSFEIIYVLDVFAQGPGGETSAAAYFRDPISATGGVTITANGPIAGVPEPRALGFGVAGLIALGARRARRRAID